MYQKYRKIRVFLLVLFNNTVTIIVFSFAVPIGDQLVDFHHSFNLDDLQKNKWKSLKNSFLISF